MTKYRTSVTKLFLFCFLTALNFLNAFGQDPLGYLGRFDSKIYSLKSKGVREFVVDIESSQLLQNMNDSMSFGTLKELYFRVYWTANPERLAIEVFGLPEGFKEVKENLKLSVFPLIDNLIPQTLVQRFSGYKLTNTSSPKVVSATDSTGLAAIQSFSINFNNEDILKEIIGHKIIGTAISTPEYEKESFAGGKLVLTSLKTVNSENGQSLTVVKDLTYGETEGIGTLNRVTIKSVQRSDTPGANTIKMEEVIEFKNYKINQGSALKYFLGEN